VETLTSKRRPDGVEAEEAKWWPENQELIADRFRRAKASGSR